MKKINYQYMLKPAFIAGLALYSYTTIAGNCWTRPDDQESKGYSRRTSPYNAEDHKRDLDPIYQSKHRKPTVKGDRLVNPFYGPVKGDERESESGLTVTFYEQAKLLKEEMEKKDNDAKEVQSILFQLLKSKLLS